MAAHICLKSVLDSIDERYSLKVQFYTRIFDPEDLESEACLEWLSFGFSGELCSCAFSHVSKLILNCMLQRMLIWQLARLSGDHLRVTDWHQDSWVLLSTLLSIVVLGQMTSLLGDSVSMSVKREVKMK